MQSRPPAERAVGEHHNSVMVGRAGECAALLRRPGAARLLLASSVGRLPIGMTPLALIYATRAEHGSYALAGAAVASYALGVAIGQPLASYAVDRGVRVLAPLGLLFAAALVTTGVAAGTPTTVVMGSALTGVLLPPVGACMRATWPRLVSSAAERETAYALEGALQELPTLTGPLLVGLLVSVATPSLAVLVCAGCGASGALAFSAAAPRTASRPSTSTLPALEALRPPGVRVVCAAVAGTAGMTGVVEVVMPAFAERVGSRADGGLLMAAFAFGSLLGGAAAALGWTGGNPRSRYLGALVLSLAGSVILLGPSDLAAMGLAAVAAGAPTAPVFGAAYTQLGALASESAGAETFGWMATFGMAASAGGNVAAGWVTHRLGITAAIALAPAFTALALAIALGFRGQLAVSARPEGTRASGQGELE